jgi:hypothetical protein
MDKLYYKKNKNNLKHLEILELENIQNYIPIYSTFFTLNDTNWNNINLNHLWSIQTIHSNIKKNSYYCTLTNEQEVSEKPVFFKFSPLVDPFKYVIGMYSLDNILTLPNLINKSECNPKINDANNSGYTDGFFYYLSSKLLNDYNFVHGIDFYGSYLAIKNNFQFNVYDDFDYVKNDSYVIKNYNKLFKFNEELGQIFFRDSKTSKPCLTIEEDSKIELPIFDLETLNTSSVVSEELKDVTDSFKCDENITIDESKSECSNDTEDSKSIDDESTVEWIEDEKEESYSDDDISYQSDDEVVNMTIYKLPVHVIAIEKCKCTLDRLITNDLPDKELIAALFQVIMILLTYQKVFDFTHNDLHTNNIMYIDTDEKYLYYCYENIHYKVPTYGKIFKIIDFGRSIYQYNGIQIVSDSFGPNGDAKTQYNIPPYVNESKPLLHPHYSFDLCRLGCSLYDVFEPNDKSSVKKLVEEWCKDDKGRNILYKKDGGERYPDFKLYKMIARTVHEHTPKNQLKRDIFKKFISTKPPKKDKIMNIDEYPSFSV